MKAVVNGKIVLKNGVLENKDKHQYQIMMTE